MAPRSALKVSCLRLPVVSTLLYRRIILGRSLLHFGVTNALLATKKINQFLYTAIDATLKAQSISEA